MISWIIKLEWGLATLYDNGKVSENRGINIKKLVKTMLVVYL